MNLKSLEKVLEGVGKLRAASIVAWAVNAAAFLSLSVPASVQSSAVISATVLLAVVNAADSFIRGKHVAALPALIAQGAESVTKVQDPRVDNIANSIALIARRVASLEATPTPSLPEVIAALTGKDTPASTAVFDQDAAPTGVVAPAPTAPAAS